MFNKVSNKIKKDHEVGARRQLIEELFYDFHSSRAQVYFMNFTRGLFFGFGTILGGTVLVAILLWVLGQLAFFPYVGEYIQKIIETMQATR